jgi:hypothetical protein
MRVMRWPFVIAVLTLTATPAVRACSIPVFRYALERWKPSSYEFVVYHRGELSEAERKALRQIEDIVRTANGEVIEVDLDGNREPQLKALWKKHGGDAKLPRVLVRFPESDSMTPLAWSGPLDPAQIKPLVDSPLRRQIVNGFFRGESAMFAMLESGDAKADADAAKFLTGELAKLEKTVPIPAITKEGPQVRSELPVRIGFGLLTVSRKNSSESAFIDMLLRCEEDLDQVKGPIVFAFFGRGRVLTALHGKDLKAKELEEICKFICGACSCQVKELNPGVDLLFAAKWDAFLDIELAPSPREVRVLPKR